MHTVTKKEMVDRIAEQSDATRVLVKEILQCFLNEVVNELGRGNRLEFRDFGVFETKESAARVAQNPKTLQRVNVPPKRTVKFKAGRLMKQELQRGLERKSGPLRLTMPSQPPVARPANPPSPRGPRDTADE